MYIYDRRLTGTPSGTLGLSPESVGVGVAVLQLAQSLVKESTDGSFSTKFTPTSYTRPNTPHDIPFRTKTVEFEIKATYPAIRYASKAMLSPAAALLKGTTQSFWFWLSFQYNGLDIKSVLIDPQTNRSSSMISSTFSIEFISEAYSHPTAQVAVLKLHISGHWNPFGFGYVPFRGELVVKATGEVSRPNIFRTDDNDNMVQAGAFKQLSDTGSPLSRRVETFLDVLFPQPGSDTVKPGTEEEIVAWYRRLPQNIREQIQAGSTPVQILGYASRTGSVTINRELSRRRAARVQQILRDFAGPNAQLQIFAHGEFEAVTPDKIESPQERRVRITVTHYAPGGSQSILADRRRNVIESAMRLGDESAALQMAMSQGIRDVNRLTNLLFFARHPERKGRKLSRREQDFSRLSEEWVNIRDRLVMPALTRTRPTLR